MEKLREFYREEFLRFESGKSREAGKMDNAIFLVSTGTLVLSINYIITLEDKKLLDTNLIIFSWITLLLSVVMHIISYYCSKKFHIKYLEDLNNWAENDFKGSLKNIKSKSTIKYEKEIMLITNLSLIFLLLGLSLITWFTILNLLF